MLAAIFCGGWGGNLRGHIRGEKSSNEAKNLGLCGNPEPWSLDSSSSSS